MAMQKTISGGILRTTTSGGIAKECCCGGAQPSNCSNGDPEMYLRILDADYAGASIEWCGETWTQQDVKDGVEKGPICPTSYSRSKNTYTISSDPMPGYYRKFWTANEAWRYNTASGMSLRDGGYKLFRNYKNTGAPYGNFLRYAASPLLKIKPGGVIFSDALQTSAASSATARPVLATTGTAFAYYIGKLAVGFGFSNILLNLMTYSNYRLSRTPGFFNDTDPTTFYNFTSAGIQYSWRQGNGW